MEGAIFTDRGDFECGEGIIICRGLCVTKYLDGFIKIPEEIHYDRSAMCRDKIGKDYEW